MTGKVKDSNNLYGSNLFPMLIVNDLVKEKDNHLVGKLHEIIKDLSSTLQFHLINGTNSSSTR